MASAKATKPDVVTYGDHEVITPDTSKLRKAVRPRQSPASDDPVARAEAGAGADFQRVRDLDARRMRAARRRAASASRRRASTRQTSQELFLAAHDIKGDCGDVRLSGGGAAPPTACAGCSSTRPDLAKIPLTLIDQHVDAVRAIVREYARADIRSDRDRARRNGCVRSPTNS